MEKTTHQIEKNVSASFAYVKKDMLMLNDAFSDIHDKVQHLSLNHAMLLEEIGKLRSELSKLSKPKKIVAKKKAVKKKTTKKAKPKTKKKSTKTSKKGDVKKVVKTEEIVYS
jgi:regulator of replication initiation timing|tara:strand:+ start:347 stop:682 length:336 start_codon:yes stop_codon:yes gene_type:complete